MVWKKALFLGGAVLLLAACSDATAPRPQVRGGSAPTANLVAPVQPIANSIDPFGLVDDCRSGYYVRSGDKDLCVEIPQ